MTGNKVDKELIDFIVEALLEIADYKDITTGPTGVRFKVSINTLKEAYELGIYRYKNATFAELYPEPVWTKKDMDDEE